MEKKILRKTTYISICAFVLIAGLHYGAALLIPVTFAAFFATLVLPFANKMESRLNAGRLTSSFFSTLLVFLGVGLLFFFLINEMRRFLVDIVERRSEIITYFEILQERLAVNTGFSLEQQKEIMRDSVVSLINVTQTYVSGFLSDLLASLLDFLLMLVFVFLILVNRDKMAEFIMMYTSKENEGEVNNIIGESSQVAHKYLWGRIQVMTVLAIMYFILFTAYDMQHVGLLVIFGALITIIPFIGPFLSGVLPILFMIGFGGTFTEVVSFTLIIGTIQLIESYVLEPLLMGSELQQSPLFVIIAVLLGGMVWGPAGFILFVPIFAIIKIIFDHIPNLEPVGFLMGYERPGSEEGWIEKIKSKIRK